MDLQKSIMRCAASQAEQFLKFGQTQSKFISMVSDTEALELLTIVDGNMNLPKY